VKKIRLAAALAFALAISPALADGVSIPGLNSIGGKTSVQFPPTAGGPAILACSYTPVTTGTEGTAYTGATPSPSGGTSPYTFSETGSLPTGLSINTTTGVISGTPSASGSFASIQVSVADSASHAANCGAAFTLVISPSGGGASFVFRGGQNQTALTLSDSNTVGTYAAMNLGTGSQFIILAQANQALLLSSGATVTKLTVNGTTLTPVPNGSDVSLGGIDTLYAGTVTTTGSDVVQVTYSASAQFSDQNVAVWTASGLTSTTPLFSTGYTQTTSVPAAAGNLLFAFASTGATGTFTSPTGITNETEITGLDGGNSFPADTTVTSGMISGGDVTVTFSADVFGVVAIWD
jgi:Putative Ig domain